MNQIAATFADHFANWHIRLPEKHLRTKQRGELRKEGWTIRFLFGSNDRGEFLDYYASNRFTDDRHVRIYADGSVEALPTISDVIVFPKGSTPEERDRIEAQHAEENRRVAELLKAKGFP